MSVIDSDHIVHSTESLVQLLNKLKIDLINKRGETNEFYLDVQKYFLPLYKIHDLFPWIREFIRLIIRFRLENGFETSSSSFYFEEHIPQENICFEQLVILGRTNTHVKVSIFYIYTTLFVYFLINLYVHYIDYIII